MSGSTPNARSLALDDMPIDHLARAAIFAGLEGIEQNRIGE